VRLFYYRILSGVILVLVGVLIWLNNLEVVHIYWKRDWPVLLIAIGLIEVIKNIMKKA
jgi:hypothetical protein